MAQTSERRVLRLWEGGAPGFEARKDEPETAKDWWINNIHHPSLTVFLPPAEKANGTAVIIAPGGGLRELVFDGEGRRAAEFLNERGIAAFALKYRLPKQAESPYSIEHVRQDAERSVRLVRSRASEFHLDPKRVGFLGFSAGGTVAATIAYSSGPGDPGAADPVERHDSKPDFQMLIYPGGPVPEFVTADAPPTFILVSSDDDYGCDQVSLELFSKLHAAKVRVEAHFLAQGKHGFNMGDRSSLVSVRTWPERMADWLKDSGYLERAA